MSVLLTDEAVRATLRACVSDKYVEGHRRGAIEKFLRYHATEGRPALVDAAYEALAARWPEDTHTELRRDAEAVVTALFGGEG